MRVLLIQDQDGGFEVVTDGPAEVITVSEHTPHDRLYRLTEAHTVSPERVDEVLSAEEIGSSGDDRHEAISNRIVSAMEGQPHLRSVK